MLSVTELPLKDGTCALRKTVWMQLPTGVPANGGERPTAATGPSGEKVMLAVPPPVGPPSRLQLMAELAALLSAVRAELRFKGAR